MQRVPKSPVFSADHDWPAEKSKRLYESDITAFVRGMLSDETIREDQRAAWERWRNDPTPLNKP